MRLTPDFERTLRRYVLGGLDDDLRVELEELLITDPDAFEALGVIEDELLEEYLEEAGSADERQSFERRFLTSPERRRRLGIARALRDRASRVDERPHGETLPAPTSTLRPPVWAETLGGWTRSLRREPAWIALAAVLAVSLIGNVWLASRYHAQGQILAATPTAAMPPESTGELTAQNRELQARLGQEQQERSKAESRASALEAQLGRPRTPVPTFALAAGLLRARGALPRLTVPPDVPVVRLRLELAENAYPSYRATLHDPDGGEIWAVSKLRAVEKAEGPAVVVAVPSELLPRGDYLVKLSGLRDGAEPEAVATYPFRVAAP